MCTCSFLKACADKQNACKFWNKIQRYEKKTIDMFCYENSFFLNEFYFEFKKSYKKQNKTKQNNERTKISQLNKQKTTLSLLRIPVVTKE